MLGTNTIGISRSPTASITRLASTAPVNHRSPRSGTCGGPGRVFVDKQDFTGYCGWQG
jgi:hypothetical protein